MPRVRFWPPGKHPVSEPENAPNVGPYGSRRHPTVAAGGPRPAGHHPRGNVTTRQVQVSEPDAFSEQAASLGFVTNTVSPWSNGAGGSGYFQELDGFGVDGHRFAGKLPYALQNFSAPIRPIKDPTAIRLGMQAGPSQMPVFPSTGIDANLASLAAMTNGSLGMGA